MAKKHEVEIQLVQPPKPVPPKVEPPKPPPKARVKRQQVLPQIQPATPDTPSVDAAPTEAPFVAVAPASEPSPSPPPEPEPITAPFGEHTGITCVAVLPDTQ